jgi:K+-transporting ATPase A subunit
VTVAEGILLAVAVAVFIYFPMLVLGPIAERIVG